MDESKIDEATLEEWSRAKKALIHLVGEEKFKELLEAANKRLVHRIKKEPLASIVITETNDVLVRSQMEIMMIRAAAYEMAK